MDVPSISVTDIQKNPQRCCEVRWGDTPEALKKLAETNDRIASIENLKQLLKQKKNEKQICARDFGKIKSENGDVTQIKAQMQKVSADLANLEGQRKTLEEQLLQLFVETDVESPATLRAFPVCFDQLGASTAISSVTTEVEDRNADEWDQYVLSHPQASLYHQYTWRKVIRESFGHPTYYLAARDASGKICGVLPLIRLRSFLFGDFAVSMPFFNYGGVLADSSEIAQQLLARAAELAKTNKLQHLEIRQMQPVNEWPARTDKVSMIRRLPATQEKLDEELGAKVRAQIKRARQENIQVRVGHLDLLDAFYRVFAINMRDLGTPVYGKNFFRSILAAQPDHAHIVTVFMNNKPVAAAFLLGHRDMMEIPWASTLRSANAVGINMVLYREVLKLCIEEKYEFFDFGRSSKDSGTYRFKKQWGAQPLQHYWHYWLQNGGPLPELKPDSPKFRLLIAIWQRLPVAISKLLGPMIVKYLP